jgi:hypothetical protein
MIPFLKSLVVPLRRAGGNGARQAAPMGRKFPPMAAARGTIQLEFLRRLNLSRNHWEVNETAKPEWEKTAFNSTSLPPAINRRRQINRRA